MAPRLSTWKPVCDPHHQLHVRCLFFLRTMLIVDFSDLFRRPLSYMIVTWLHWPIIHTVKKKFTGQVASTCCLAIYMLGWHTQPRKNRRGTLCACVLNLALALFFEWSILKIGKLMEAAASPPLPAGKDLILALLLLIGSLARHASSGESMKEIMHEWASSFFFFLGEGASS